MQPSLNKKNFQAKSSMPELSAEKFKHTRPNIDHLIKRILVERRKEQISPRQFPRYIRLFRAKEADIVW